MRLDHVGIATSEAAELAATLADLFAVRVVHEETFEGNRVVFLDMGGEVDGSREEASDDHGGPYLELLEPTGDEGAIARFLDRDGPGLHHVAFATRDAARALDRARGMGIETVDDEPRPGAWGHEVAFLHPSDTGGVLVEFVEH